MTRWLRGLTVVVAVLAAGTLSFDAVAQGAKSKQKQRTPTISFQEDIVPILKGRCVDCHQPGGAGFDTSGLDLRTHAGVMKGTKFGPMVVAGDPEASSLMALLDWRVKPEIRMPHGMKKLSTCDRDAIRRWIREGALNN
ncbi:hypothetical protein PQJ75_23390 [Rhodoplanes sp. TEM]|uniref:Cytochrome c domain-containing protein n=1 Tax=Rhodoplanes tepidamans TaxID=200616 RepID=A0ABT5J5R1_RHOTP|nr:MULTISPECIES: c-type cytochrome domain-containing protein [Rhodoplanes]MDC7784993.1 hypothetical protein [Rhodoplanes tepidamans]MDC7986684.1 hypothetical protein [Rhodoplanes sp. TEM]MDQ0353776.1 mono/diheme cytochrome c family protein [Rhodoplanes tepidamans]